MTLEQQQRWTPEGIQQLFRQSADLKMEQYELGDADHRQTVYLLYCEGLAETKRIDEVLRRLDIMINAEFGGELDSKWQVSRVSQPEEIVKRVFSGQLLLYLVKHDLVYALDISNPPHRSIEESNTEISIKGPKDAFVEELDTNVALVRKRLRSNSLRYEQFSIGRRSEAKVALLYIEDITQPRLVEEARRRLQDLDLDVMLGSSQLEELLADRKITLLPLLHYTTRPDFVVDCLIRGRFAILAEGAPTAVIGPANLTLLLKTPEDAYLPFHMGSFGLWFRFVGLVIGLLLPGFWIAVASYNIEQIPYPLVATISMSRIGLPLPAALEGFLMMGLFELFREASERLPKAVGQTVAVVGGIVVGDAAIRAGLASTTFLVISSVTVVASFTLVNQSLVGAVSLIRLFVMLCSSTLGMYGFILSTIAIVLYMSTLESFGVPYLAPLTPLRWKDLLNTLARKPWILKKQRAEILKTSDSTRQGEEKP
jgi:hypothetical protein